MASKPMWRKLISDALPKRELAVERDTLILAILERIRSWKVTAPQIEPYADRVRKASAIAKKLAGAINVAGAALMKLRVDKDIQKAKAQRVAIGVPEAEVPLGGHSAALDLLLIVWRASDGLRKWDQMHSTKAQRPKEFGPALTADLHRVCRTFAGCSAYEFEDFLHSINGSALWRRARLPGLRWATVKKRKQRANKTRDKLPRKGR